MTPEALIERVAALIVSGDLRGAITEIEAEIETKYAVPAKEIIDLYHTHLPMLPKVASLTAGRRQVLNARWASKAEYRSLEWWRRYFIRVARSDFLTGRKVSWKASFDWLLGPKNFQKILEGNYDPASNSSDTYIDSLSEATIAAQDAIHGT